jgi:hypothetical protein
MTLQPLFYAWFLFSCGWYSHTLWIVMGLHPSKSIMNWEKEKAFNTIEQPSLAYFKCAQNTDFSLQIGRNHLTQACCIKKCWISHISCNLLRSNIQKKKVLGTQHTIGCAHGVGDDRDLWWFTTSAQHPQRGSDCTWLVWKKSEVEQFLLSVCCFHIIIKSNKL